MCTQHVSFLKIVLVLIAIGLKYLYFFLYIAGFCSDLEENATYEGGDYGGVIEVPSFEYCRTYCQKIPGCAGWSFESNSTLGQLKWNLRQQEKENRTNCISGRKFCGGNIYIIVYVIVYDIML